jgi:hypothetical protein
MTLPVGKVEMMIGATWTDITSDVLERDDIVIIRGKGDPESTFIPSTCRFSLNNRDGKYSPRNPNGPYYGKIGRNTPVRVTASWGGASYPRFYGETTELPPRWDVSGNDAWVPVEAASPLRRIGQGSQPVDSGLKTFYTSISPVTYWPLSDGTQATSGAPAAGSYRKSTFHKDNGAAVVTWGAGFLADYLPLVLRINDTNPAAGTDRMIGQCFGADSTPDAVAMDLVWKIDTEIVPGTMTAYPAGNFHVHLFLSGAVGGDDWDLLFRHDGTNDDVTFQVISDDGLGGFSTTSLGNSAILTAVQDTELHHLRILLVPSGADVVYTIYIDGVSVLTGTHNTYTAHTLPTTDSISVEYNRNSNTADGLIAIGHVAAFENAVNIPAIADTVLAVNGHAGEAAGRRFERLCTALDVPFVTTGNLDDTQHMGLEHEDYFSNQLREIEATDDGTLYDDRASLAIGYRTRTSFYTQTPAATLSFAALQIAPPFQPIDDDQLTRNDIFAQNRDGGSFQATKTSGPLSVNDPPYIAIGNTGGVGRYKDEYQVNVETDAMLTGIGYWRLSLGTVDEARYPQISVNLAMPWVNNHPTLAGNLLTLDVGGVIALTEGARFNFYDDIKQMVIGYTETIGTDEYDITFNTAPYSPYDIAKYGSAVGSGPDRYDTAGSTLTSDVTATATSLSITSPQTLWTTVGGEFPFDVFMGGERMTVTTITGSTSPQTFTVVRSVNGVTKPQLAGTSLRLWKTPRYGRQGV